MGVGLPSQDTSAWRPRLRQWNESAYRCHLAKNGAIFFNRSHDWRFNAPVNQFGVCYLGSDPSTCFVETFMHDGRPEIISRQAIQRRLIAEVTFASALDLIDLTDGGALMIGADNNLMTGSIFISQHWALSIHQRPENFDGILYSSRTSSGPCIALFDRAAMRIANVRSESWFSSTYSPLLFGTLRAFQVEFVDADVPIEL